MIKYLTAEAQKEYGYPIAYLIEYRKEYAFPLPQKMTSENPDPDSKKVEQEALDALFQQEIKNFAQTMKKYKKQKQQLCGTILKKMSVGLEESLKKESEYPMKKGTDPIWLLEKIDYYCKTYRGNKYLPAVYMNAAKDVTEIMQSQNEAVSSFAKRLKSRMSLMWKTMQADGDVKYHKLIDQLKNEMQGLTDDEAAEQARERVLAFQLINRANPKRFGDLKEEIEKLKSRDVEKYPSTLAKAMEILQAYEQQKRKEYKHKEGNQKDKSHMEKVVTKKIRKSKVHMPKRAKSLRKCISAESVEYRDVIRLRINAQIMGNQCISRPGIKH